MLKDVINYQLNNQLCLNFVHVSKYGDQTHSKNFNSVSQLEIGQASYLLNHPHKMGASFKYYFFIYVLSLSLLCCFVCSLKGLGL